MRLLIGAALGALALTSCFDVASLSRCTETPELCADGGAGDPDAGTQTTPPPEIPANNRTSNPSFEANLGGWAPTQGTVTREAAADAPHGEWVVRVVGQVEGYFTIDDQPDTVASCVAGATYVASAWVAAGSEAEVGALISLRMREWAPQRLEQERSSDASLTRDFQRLSASLDCARGGNGVDMRLSYPFGQPGSSFRADVLVLQGP